MWIFEIIVQILWINFLNSSICGCQFCMLSSRLLSRWQCGERRECDKVFLIWSLNAEAFLDYPSTSRGLKTSENINVTTSRHILPLGWNGSIKTAWNMWERSHHTSSLSFFIHWQPIHCECPELGKKGENIDFQAETKLQLRSRGDIFHIQKLQIGHLLILDQLQAALRHFVSYPQETITGAQLETEGYLWSESIILFLFLFFSPPSNNLLVTIKKIW